MIIRQMSRLFKNKFMTSLKDNNIKLNLSFAILPLRYNEYNLLNYKLDVFLEDIAFNSVLNSSGYYLFLNLSYAQRYLLRITSDNDFEIKNFLDLDETTFHDPSNLGGNKLVLDPVIRAFIREKINLREKVEKMDENTKFFLLNTSILTYASKKSHN